MAGGGEGTAERSGSVDVWSAEGMEAAVGAVGVTADRAMTVDGGEGEGGAAVGVLVVAVGAVVVGTCVGTGNALGSCVGDAADGAGVGTAPGVRVPLCAGLGAVVTANTGVGVAVVRAFVEENASAEGLERDEDSVRYVDGPWRGGLVAAGARPPLPCENNNKTNGRPQ